MFSIESLPRLTVEEARAKIRLHGGIIASEALEALDAALDPLAEMDDVQWQEIRSQFAEAAKLAASMGQDNSHLLALAAQPKPDVPIVDSDIRLYEGDLIVDTLDVNCDVLLVLGNLRVKGLLQSDHSCECGSLIVFGACHAMDVICTGNLITRDEFAARHVVASTSNDCSLVVGGDAKVVSLVECGQFVRIKGSVEAAVLASTSNAIEVDGKSNVRDVLNRSMSSLLLLKVLKTELLITGEYEEGASNDIDPGATHYAYINFDAYCDALRRGIDPTN